MDGMRSWLGAVAQPKAEGLRGPGNQNSAEGARCQFLWDSLRRQYHRSRPRGGAVATAHYRSRPFRRRNGLPVDSYPCGQYECEPQHTSSAELEQGSMDAF